MMTRPYLPCDGLYCPCQDHVDTDTHVPVCPVHTIPLVADPDDPGAGLCLWTRVPSRELSRVERLVSGLAIVKTCATWGPASWVWKPRDTFATEDLPPHNGWKPVDYEAAGVTS